MWKVPQITPNDFRAQVETDMALSTFVMAKFLKYDGIRIPGLIRKTSATLYLADRLLTQLNGRLLTSGFYYVAKNSVNLRVLKSFTDLEFSNLVKHCHEFYEPSELIDDILTEIVAEIAGLSATQLAQHIESFVSLRKYTELLITSHHFNAQSSNTIKSLEFLGLDERNFTELDYTFCFTQVYLNGTAQSTNAS